MSARSLPRLPHGLTVDDLHHARDRVSIALPHVSAEAVDGLKFSAASPPDLARATLAERGADRPHATTVLRERIVVR